MNWAAYEAKALSEKLCSETEPAEFKSLNIVSCLEFDLHINLRVFMIGNDVNEQVKHINIVFL